jgi:TP901 family phage tail tape measure protein
MAATMRIPTEFTAIDKFTSVVSKMTSGVSNFSNSTTAAIDRFNTKANKVAGDMAIAGGAIVAPLGLAVNSAIKFEDKMADVAKTTGLSTSESEAYGKAILDMSKNTRTSISALQDIGIVAGTIGVAKDELVAFTKAGNEFAIALGSDFGSTEEAVTQVAKLKNLFKETRDIDIATSMTKAGSAINEVSNMAGSADNINNFMLRIGALPDAMKPTIQQSAALGGFLEDAGLSAEIAAGGFSNLILVAGKNMTGFANQMGMTVESANKLYQTDPTQFAVKFSKSLSKLKPRELAMTLEQLKVGSQESIKVVGALGSGYEKLGKVMNASNDAFTKGTSISDEAAKKNETMAGKLAMAQNNIQTLSIVIGTQLAPILSQLISYVTPIITSFTTWIAENPKLTKTIAFLGLGLLGLSAIIKGVTVVSTIAGSAMKLYGYYQKTMAGETGLATAAQWALNAAMTANPIGIIIVAIAAMVALIIGAIAYWEDWGAAILLMTGPIGWIINLFMSLRKHWDSIVEAFSSGGIIQGFKRLGAVILDSVLYPVQQLLGMLAKIPGVGTLLAPALKGIEILREKLDVVEPKQDAMVNKTEMKGNINMTVNDKQNNIGAIQTDFGGIGVNTTKTQGAF